MYNTATARRRKFQRFFAQRNDYQIFVGVPLAEPSAWDQVLTLETNILVAVEHQEYRVEEVRSWLVAYSDTGEIVDAENLFTPLPPGINSILSGEQSLPNFSAADLQRGHGMVKIRFGKSSTHSENPIYYSTSLTNISSHKIRCHAFGAYRPTKDGFEVCTVTNTLFSKSQFEEWYGVRRGGWIESGETVTDPSNYGRGCIWVYYFETEQNIKFHVGKSCPRLGFAQRFLTLFGRKKPI